MGATTTSTTPTLTIDGTHAVVSGVAFTWLVRCWWCRAAFRLTAEGGKVRLGLNISSTGKTCRWYYTPVAPAIPAAPEACPECGHDRPFSAWDIRHSEHILPANNIIPLTDEVWRTIRAQRPAEVAKADYAAERARLRG